MVKSELIHLEIWMKFLFRSYIVLLVIQSCPTLCNSIDCIPPGSCGLLCSWDCPGKNGNTPFPMEWVAVSCSRGSSRPSIQTWFSCTAGRFFPVSYREVPIQLMAMFKKIGGCSHNSKYTKNH